MLDARLLGKQMDSAKDPTLKLGAATSIVLIARSAPTAFSDDSMRWARGALADNKWAIREAAVEVIGDSTADDAVPLLAKLLTDSHPMVRQTAARALGRRKGGQRGRGSARWSEGRRGGGASGSAARSAQAQQEPVDRRSQKLAEDANAMVQERRSVAVPTLKKPWRVRCCWAWVTSRSSTGCAIWRRTAAPMSDSWWSINLSGQSDVMLLCSPTARLPCASVPPSSSPRRVTSIHPGAARALEHKGPEALQALVLLRKAGRESRSAAGPGQRRFVGPAGAAPGRCRDSIPPCRPSSR